MEEVTSNSHFSALPDEIKVFVLSLLNTQDLLNFVSAYNLEEYLTCDKDVIK